MGVALRAAADPAPPAWDGAAAAHARLEDEAVTAVALLERFGDLLAVALDAAVAERAWVVSELRPLLAALREAKRSGAHVPAEAARLAQVLAPVDVALRQAGLLHERLTDDVDRWAPIALVR